LEDDDGLRACDVCDDDQEDDDDDASLSSDEDEYVGLLCVVALSDLLRVVCLVALPGFFVTLSGFFDPLPRFFELPTSFPLALRPTATFSGDEDEDAALRRVVAPSRLLRNVALPGLLELPSSFPFALRPTATFFAARFGSPDLASEEVPFPLLSTLCFFGVGAIPNNKRYTENEN
jgi:hypothetical protein